MRLGGAVGQIGDVGFNGDIDHAQVLDYFDTSLPVELATVTATSEGHSVTLFWVTETETNNIGFSVYRSDSQKGNYTKIAFINGAGNSGMPQEYHFKDSSVEPRNTYFYYLEDLDIAGESSQSEIIKVVVTPQKKLQFVVPPTKLVRSIPKASRLRQNFPNPFNPETWLPYELAEDASVSVDIYNVKGQVVRKLNLGPQKAGYYVRKDQAAYWDGRDRFGQRVTSGLYFYTLQAGNFTATRRLVILK